MAGSKKKPKTAHQIERTAVRYTRAEQARIDHLLKVFGYRKRATFVHDVIIAIEEVVRVGIIDEETFSSWLRAVPKSTPYRRPKPPKP